MATFHKYKKQGKEFWEYRIYYNDPITRKIREKSKKNFTSKGKAKSAAEEMERMLSDGIVETNESLNSYLMTWLEEFKKGTVRKNTFELHEQNIRKHILPYFKNILLKDITLVHYQKFINYLAKTEYTKGKTYSRRTIEIIHGTMYGALDKAVTMDKIKKNPCIGVVIKGEKKERGIQFIESEHIADFLKEAYQYHYNYWIFFKTLIETGMRKGEAAALKWTDVDLEQRTISINKSLDFKEAAKSPDRMFGNTKTFKSKRVISMSKSLFDDLMFHKQYQEKNKDALKSAYKSKLDLVLCRNDGNYMPNASLANAFKKILKNANLPSLPIHSTRHTHAVLQLEAGASMKYIQERLGHGSAQITSDVYSHISKKLDKDAMNNFEMLMDNILK